MSMRNEKKAWAQCEQASPQYDQTPTSARRVLGASQGGNPFLRVSFAFRAAGLEKV